MEGEWTWLGLVAGWLLLLLVFAWRDGWMDVCNVVEQQAGKKTVEFVEATNIPVPSFLSVLVVLLASRPGYL